MKGSGWARRLRVEATGKGQVGQAGMVLLRTTADKCGLTSSLSGKVGSSPVASWIDRAQALVYTACAIALGATSMSDVERMAHHHAGLGLSAGSDSTIHRMLTGIDEQTRKRIGRARAAARKIARGLIGAREAGFPWIEVAGKTLTGWIVIDLDATIITAASKKEGAAGTFKGSFGHHPLAAWCANTFECLAMALRPGNAAANDAADHIRVLSAALRQLPRVGYRKILVRIDGAGATHALLDHLEGLNHAARRVAWTVGWKITDADEAAIAGLPETAWSVAATQDGQVKPGYGVAELTGLNTRTGWPKDLRLIVRRCLPSGRQRRNMTEFERSTGYVYSIVATNISRLKGIAGSHTTQWLDALHRDHAEVEDRVRTNKATGLHNLPSKSWQVNESWILAANLAADLDAWTRLLGFAGDDELETAEPDSMRSKIYSLGARLVRHARTRTLKLPDTWPWSRHFAAAWAVLTALPDPAT